MRSPRLLLLSAALLPLLLSSCQKQGLPTRVKLMFGTEIGMGEKVEGNSHLRRLSASSLASLVVKKGNFILLVHNGMQDTCTCYSDWHDRVLAPYIKKHRLLVYLIELSELEKPGAATYGLQLYQSSETLGIFQDGALLYQENNSDPKAEWTKSPEGFAAWMDLRLQAPSMFYLDRKQLEEKYRGHQEFTIYFSRSSCPDCSFFEEHDLKDYLFSHDGLLPSYLLDCDAAGIRGYEEEGVVYWPSSSPAATEGQKKAAAQWQAFKQEYGLAFLEDNPAGYQSGMIPTLFHVKPEGSGKKTGDVIDGAAVVYNDVIDEASLAIASSYFTPERLTEAANTYFTYLSDSSLKLEDKIVLGQKVSPRGDRSEETWLHEELQRYHRPLAAAFLDWSIANK